MKKENVKLALQLGFWKVALPLIAILCIYYTSFKVRYRDFIPDIIHFYFYPRSLGIKKYRYAQVGSPLRWTLWLLVRYKEFTVKKILKTWYDGLFRAY